MRRQVPLALRVSQVPRPPLGASREGIPAGAEELGALTQGDRSGEFANCAVQGTLHLNTPAHACRHTRIRD